MLLVIMKPAATYFSFSFRLVCVEL